MTYQVIEGIIQYNAGIETVWNQTTEPVPNKVLAYALDTKIMKLGNGTDLWDELPSFMDLNDPIAAQLFTTKFDEVTGGDASKLINVKADGTGFEYATLVLNDVALKTAMNSELTDKAAAAHSHDYVTTATADDLVQDYSMNKSDEEALSYLLMKAVAEEGISSMITPKGVVDEYLTTDLIDGEMSTVNVNEGYFDKLAPGVDYLTPVSVSNPTSRSRYILEEYNNEWYMYGGRASDNSKLDDMWKYNPLTKIWTELQGGPSELEDHSASFIGSDLYIYGGVSNSVAYVNTIYIYHTTTNTWSTVTTEQTGRFSHVSAVYNGKLYVIGGTADGGTASEEVWEFDPAGPTWTQKESCAATLVATSVIEYNSLFYVVGGWNGSDTYYTKIRTYNPVLNTWTDLADIANGKYYPTIGNIADKLYIIGGVISGGYSDTIESYDLNTEEVALLDVTLPEARGYSQCINCSNFLVIGTGINIGGYINTYVQFTIANDLTVVSSTLPGITSNIDTVDITFKGSNLGIPNGNTTVEISRDGGTSWAATAIKKHELSVGVLDLYRGTCDFTKSLLKGSIVAAEFNIEDLKGDITQFIVDSENQNGHFDSAALFDLTGCTMKIGESKIVIAEMTGDGTGAGSVKFYDILAGTQTVASIQKSIIENEALVDSEYTLSINQWLNFNPNDTTGRSYHSAAISGDYMYIYGGRISAYVNTLHRYSFKTKEWTILNANTNDTNGRAYHSAVIVGDKMYVYGGYNVNDLYLNTMHIYDITNNTWSVGAANTNDANGRRAYSIEVYNNKLYVYGGYNATDDYTNALYIYDITGNSWSIGTANPNDATYGRAVHSSSIDNGLMYIYGGRDNNGDYLNSLHVYDIDGDIWSVLTANANDTNGRYGHKSVIYDGSLYVYAGYNATDDYLVTMHAYDISETTWSVKDDNPNAPIVTTYSGVEMYTAVLYKDSVYYYGGNCAAVTLYNFLHQYDLANNRWVEYVNSYAEGFRYSTTTLYNNKLYVYGGYDGTTYLNTLYIYDLITQQWSVGAANTNDANGRINHTAVVYEGILYIYGGNNPQDGTLFSLHKYTISTNIWTVGISNGLTQAARYSHGAVVHGSKMYVYGGYSGSSYYNSLQAYDLIDQSWSSVDANPNDLNGRREFSIVCYQDKIIIYGGYYYSGTTYYLNDIHIYDIIEGAWSTGTSNTVLAPNGIRECATTLIDDKMYCYGGFDSSIRTNDMHIYDITNNSWTELVIPDIHSGISGAKVVNYGSKIYIFGGFIDSENQELFILELTQQIGPQLTTTCSIDINDQYLAKFIGSGYTSMFYSLYLDDGYYVYKNNAWKQIVKYDTEWKYLNGEVWTTATLDNELTALTDAVSLIANQMSYFELIALDFTPIGATKLALTIPSGTDYSLSAINVVEFTDDTFDAGQDLRYRLTCSNDNAEFHGTRVHYNYVQ